MESNNKLKEIDIKSCMCYNFDDIIKIEDFNFNNTLIVEKSYENILVYSISYRTVIGDKPLCIRFNKINGFIRVYDGTRDLVLFGPEKYDAIFNRSRYLIGVKSGTRYLVLFGTEKYDAIFNRIRYLIGVKSGITYVISHY